jgi:hypothetical protein
MADKSEKAPVTQDAVHYVQNGPDQEYRDDVTSMVDMVDTLSDASCPDGADMQEEAIAALFPGAKLVSEDQADAEPIADPYHCLYCGARVTPAPASVENGWVTVCRSCTAAGR